MPNQEQSDSESIDDSQQNVADGVNDQQYAEPVPVAGAELTSAENEVLASLKKLGLEYYRHEQSLIRFRRPDDGALRSEGAIFRDRLADLGRQLDGQLINHPAKLGFVIPSRGYAEIVMRDNRWPRPAYFIERMLQMHYEELDCVHRESSRKLPSLPFSSRSLASAPLREARIHLVDQSGGPCIELSNASPLAMLLYGSPYVVPDRIPLVLTVKVDYDARIEEDALIRRTDELIRSLVYELDIRNGKVLGSAPRTLPREARRLALSKKYLDAIRYPQVRIQAEVADLFNFAGHAYDNPPLAFLSYYQTLEYFIPAAVRQSTFKIIRKELRDPTFDRQSDSCILRIVSTAERSSRLAEAEQLRALVREYVRSDRLDEFFETDWGIYFTKRGPISGVESINPSNPSKGLGDQVTDRIHQIRNRIVHAKDDPRYEDARVMLPRSQEAAALGPDIELVRLLATEAILASQAP
jgi:hypothetical protein